MPNQVAVRKVKGLYNDPEREAELFGEWQTRKWKYQLTEEGHIPMNEFGNIELMNGPLPEGTLYCNIPKVIAICKKLKLEAVPACTGFDTAKSRFVPVVQGAVVFERDLDKIKEEAKIAALKAQERLRKRVQK